ncbi:hypothetical protein CYMTET_47015, partial [Cymbomonas tetramitiformis]
IRSRCAPCFSRAARARARCAPRFSRAARARASKCKDCLLDKPAPAGRMQVAPRESRRTPRAATTGMQYDSSRRGRIL